MTRLRGNCRRECDSRSSESDQERRTLKGTGEVERRGPFTVVRTVNRQLYRLAQRAEVRRTRAVARCAYCVSSSELERRSWSRSSVFGSVAWGLVNDLVHIDRGGDEH